MGACRRLSDGRAQLCRKAPRAGEGNRPRHQGPRRRAQAQSQGVTPCKGRPRRGGKGRCRRGAALVLFAGRPYTVCNKDRRGCICRKGKRSEEHTSELQSLMRISYAVFCLKKKKKKNIKLNHKTQEHN